MAFPMGHQTAYDRATTIFSPEGDLYQVKYAFEAVKKGWTSLGVKSDSAVVLAAEKRKIMPLIDLDSIEKIYKIDDSIGVVFAGMGGDGRILIDYARVVAVRHRLLYGEPPTVELLAKAVADIKQAYTQHGGVRPFGVSLIFGGVNPDGATRIYRTDPGGQYFGFKAIAIGSGEADVNEYFEKVYRDNMTLDEMIESVIAVLYRFMLKSEEKREKLLENLHYMMEIGYITVEEKKFRKLTPEDVKKYVDKLRPDLEKLARE